MAKQHIHFARTRDGVNIAYATMGSGHPLLYLHGWVSHLEMDLESPYNAEFVTGLSAGRTLVRLDMRGCGLSDREVDDLSIEARARDIEAVADHLELERFAIFAWSINGPPAIVYAATHPERVSHLILYGTFSHMDKSGREALGRALVDLIRANWRIASKAMVEFEYPGADKDIAQSIDAYHQAASSGEVAAATLEEALFDVDVRDYLPKLTMPTLVLHRRDDQAFPARCGRELAALLPHGHFMPLPGEIHLAFMGDTQAIVEAVNDFLATGGGHDQPAEPAQATEAVHGLRTILFTDMEGSTSLTQRLGDARAQELIRVHNQVIREQVQACGGFAVKHTGDGIMASFPSAARALECAIAAQRAFARRNESAEVPIRVRIGLNAGEPVEEEDDLFGSAVQLAARITSRAEPGEVLVSDVVRQLAAGKGFLFADRGEAALHGFDEPVRLYEVRWREDG